MSGVVRVRMGVVLVRMWVVRVRMGVARVRMGVGVWGLRGGGVELLIINLMDAVLL
jgi:hypothetical protein